jgi:hypothetical protein
MDSGEVESPILVDAILETAPEDSSPPPVSSQRRRHREMLIISVAAVVLSFVLGVNSEQRVTVPGFPRLPLPPTCGSQAWFDVKCPGCGLTRSFVYLAHGQWQDAWRMHRLGWLLALALLLQFPYRIYTLVKHQDAPLGYWFPKCFGYFLIIMLIGNWVLEML